MTEYTTDLLDLRCMDCMDLMREMPDKAFELAIVDPPFGVKKLHGGKTSAIEKYGQLDTVNNMVPNPEYFTELFRVSENQIIWGGNYFLLPLTPGWIVWDKERNKGSLANFGDGELAWTSFERTLKIYKIRYDGFVGADENRIHPTQKPIRLYAKLLSEFCKPGDRILDTHLGSMSIAIACHYAGYHLTGCELDPDYFRAGVERVKRETAQRDMFQEGLI
jgi:site-specific DNA-methyltransferase (adenine-specific)